MTEAASYTDVLWVGKCCGFSKVMKQDVIPRFRQALFNRIKDMTDLELRVRTAVPVACSVQDETQTALCCC